MAIDPHLPIEPIAFPQEGTPIGFPNVEAAMSILDFWSCPSCGVPMEGRGVSQTSDLTAKVSYRLVSIYMYCPNSQCSNCVVKTVHVN